MKENTDEGRRVREKGVSCNRNQEERGERNGLRRRFKGTVADGTNWRTGEDEKDWRQVSRSHEEVMQTQKVTEGKKGQNHRGAKE